MYNWDPYSALISYDREIALTKTWRKSKDKLADRRERAQFSQVIFQPCQNSGETLADSELAK